MKKWLFIDTGSNSPVFNMEFDKGLISFYKSTRQPVLRFYAWQPSGITIGVNQSVDVGINTNYCKEKGIDIVRRVTGGEAIYHDHEITYSLVCSTDDLIGGKNLRLKVKESYKVLTEFMILFYEELGLKCQRAADFYAQNFKAQVSPFCFLGVQESDILIDGKKIGGNAQKRERDIILQHGSIPISLNYSILENIFGGGIRSEQITDIFSQRGFDLDVNYLKKILKQKFQHSLNCCMEDTKFLEPK